MNLSRRHLVARALACGLLLGSLACQAPRPTYAPPPQDLGPSSAPSWVNAPLSWEKLGDIERWLDQSVAAQDRGLAIEGRLQLAEGRVEFSRRDLERGQELDTAARARLAAARVDLAAVEADGYSTPGQRLRARLSLDGAVRLSSRLPEVRQPSETRSILSRSSWHARPAHQSGMTPLRGSWSRITVHHSAESGDAPPGASLADSVATLQRIQKVHMDPGDPQHGWADIGYHFLIDGQGRVFEGRGLGWQGAHARGANNFQNLGVCLLGDFSARSPSGPELAALEGLLDDLRERYGIPAAKIYTHRELSATACPGSILQAWVERYRRAASPRP